MTKNRVDHLHEGYKGFFGVLPYVAGSPYLAAGLTGGILLGGLMPRAHGNAMGVEEFIAGIGTCVVFTLIPVLPVCTALTSGIAVGGAVIAGLSSLITYPAAYTLDAFDQSETHLAHAH